MVKVIPIIKINNAFGNVAGCIPLFNIGGTISNVKVVMSRIADIKIIINEFIDWTINHPLK